MLEVQARLAVRSPSSASLAVPAKLIESPRLNPAPSVGALIVTTGGALALTVIVI